MKTETKQRTECEECGHPLKEGDETHYPECSQIAPPTRDQQSAQTGNTAFNYESGFIVSQPKRILKSGYVETWYIVAPSGYYRTSDGGYVADGTPSPEWGEEKHAFFFASLRAAKIQANKCHNATIHPVHRKAEGTAQ